MEESWIITGKTIATIIRNATHLSSFQIKELIAEARRECPKCKYHIDNSDVSSQWPGLPAGVKFDPSDLELLGHLEGKVGRGNRSSHILIDDFIPTIEEVEGICYTHPENLPGINMDGSRSHFFHRISNAYDCGKRKRRKISNSDHIVSDEHIRWHKTGKSTAILDNGVIKGWKKILVLHKGSKKVGGKIDKANWTMHQYHLGVEEDEKHGELVVSKVFWQLRSKQTGKSQMYAVNVETDSFAVEIDPTTPNPPQPRRPNSSTWGTEQNQEEEEFSLSTVQLKAEAEELAWSAGTSQAVEDAALPDLDEQPLCNATLDSSHEKPLPLDYCSMDDLHGFSELDYKCLGTPPDLGTLAEMQFGSQDSLGSWLDRM